MNSLFDPQCHRQVLGNRQEAKELKMGREEGEKRESGSCKVGRAAWPAEPSGGPRAPGARTRLSLPPQAEGQ